MNRKQKRVLLIAGVLAGLMLFGIIAVQAGINADGTVWVFLPHIQRGVTNNFSISGQVLSPENAPVAGVTIRTNDGHTAVTDSDGNYTLNNLDDSAYTLVPELAGAAFSPAVADVVVPPSLEQLDFTIFVTCEEAIINGGFETSTGWELPATEYTAEYTTEEVYSGTRAMRTGISNPDFNTYSYSAARQMITIPADAASALLTYYIMPQSGEVLTGALPPEPDESWGLDSVLGYDVQYVLILDQYDTWIDTLVWELSDHDWMRYEFDLSEYAGRTIQLEFGTYNDGYAGVSALYVDQVSFQICVEDEPAPTATLPPAGCSNMIGNPSFEYIGVWDIPITVYSANYSSARAHTGSLSMRSGIVNPLDNIYSYSDFRQLVTVPTGLAHVPLTFWLYPLSGEVAAGEMTISAALPNSTPTNRPFAETTLSGDLQYVLILDRYQNWIDTLVWQRSDLGSWDDYSFDLVRYAGQTIYIQFGVYNDGWGGITAMYVDDVSLENCLVAPTATYTPGPTRTSTPTRTPTLVPPATYTPGPCVEMLDNVDFEDDDGWYIPITEYSASYSSTRYLSPWHSMRTGILNSLDNRYSYSDFSQTVSLPLNGDSYELGMWLYTLSSEVLTGQTIDSAMLPDSTPTGRLFTETVLTTDLQYVLILNQFGYWIDTLVWTLEDEGSWEYYEFNLDEYAGWTITLQFGTYNNGYGGISAMYVDDVSLGACP